MRTLTIARNGLLLGLFLSRFVTATENGASVYPVGAETVLPGLTPGPGQTDLYEFTAFYQANSLMNSKGQNEVPGFHLGLEAVALKVEHNWGVRFLGGTLVSAAALPLEFVTVTTPAGTSQKTGFGNADIGVAYLAYRKGAWNWWYGLDTWTPGFEYRKGDPLNVGQHNVASVPVGAFSWLPDHGRTEVSSRISYFVNYTDPSTHYRSGNEFISEFDAMRSVVEISFGVNGYYYKQTTDDLLAQAIVGDGNRGRDLAIGPEIRGHVGRFALIAKYQKDTLVRNKPSGGMFWLQMGVPLGHVHE